MADTTFAPTRAQFSTRETITRGFVRQSDREKRGFRVLKSVVFIRRFFLTSA